jgi:hypothetical protein
MPRESALTDPASDAAVSSTVWRRTSESGRLAALTSAASKAATRPATEAGSSGVPTRAPSRSSAAERSDRSPSAASARRRSRMTAASTSRVTPMTRTPAPDPPRSRAPSTISRRPYPSVIAFETLFDTSSAAREAAVRPVRALVREVEMLMGGPQVIA